MQNKKNKVSRKGKKLHTPTHEWIKIEDRVATVGLSKEAQHAIGEIVHVELPEVGRTYAKGEEICVLESAKSAFDLYAPFEGTVVQVNAKLFKNIALINQKAETQGWLYKMEIRKLEE